MGKVLYILPLIFIFIWIVGFFFYSLGAIIHVVLLLAVVVLFIRIFLRRRPRERISEGERLKS